MVFFYCLIETDDKQNLLKQFSIKKKIKGAHEIAVSRKFKSFKTTR